MSESQDWREEASDPVQESVERIADFFDQEPDELARQAPTKLGMSVSEVEDEWAEEFNEIADDQGMPSAVQWAQQQAEAQGIDTEGGSSGPSGDGSSPEASSDSQGGSEPEPAGEVSRQEFEALQRSVQQTNSQLQELTNALEGLSQSSGGGGGGGNEAQNQIAAAVAQKFLAGNQSNPMGEFGSKLAQEAMKGWVRDMQKPDLGDLVEMQMYKDMAPELAEKYEDEIFGDFDMPEGMEEIVEGEEESEGE